MAVVVTSETFSLLSLKLFHLLLEPLDNLGAEVGPLGQLLLNFLVDLDVSLKGVNMTLHFVTFKKKLLSLFGLILQFCR